MSITILSGLLLHLRVLRPSPTVRKRHGGVEPGTKVDPISHVFLFSMEFMVTFRMCTWGRVMNNDCRRTLDKGHNSKLRSRDTEITTNLLYKPVAQRTEGSRIIHFK